MNLYITPDEIKAAAPDLIRTTTTKYDDPLYRRCVSVSRAIDRRCKRHFYPLQATQYFTVGTRGRAVLWVNDLISVEMIGVSKDNGATYTDLDASDWFTAVSEDFNAISSFNMIILDMQSNWSGFPLGQRAVRISGVWGYTDDREACWEASGITADAAMNTVVMDVVVDDPTGKDMYQLGSALQVGRLIRIGDEMMQVTGVDLEERSIRVVRGQNGSDAEAHDVDDEIYLWRPPFDISQAAMISAVRDLARAQQGYVDTRGGLEVGGKMLWVGRWDPEAEEKLSRYIRTGVG